MPHQDRGLLVFGDRAHGLALLGVGDEQLQRDHDDHAEHDGDDGRAVDLQLADRQRRNLDDGGHGLVVGAEDGLGAVLQQKAHCDCGDEGRHAVALFTNRLVCGPLHDDAHRHAHEDCGDDGHPCGQAERDDRRNGKHQHVGADHDEIAVCEVDQTNDAVHHGVAECHERVHAADLQTVEDLTDEHDDLIAHHSSFQKLMMPDF